MSPIREIAAETFCVDIFIAGELADAKRICREFCMAVGLCVTVTPADFIYTGGAESGVRVGLLNYPRFPSLPEEVLAKAGALARALVFGLHQHSALIVAPDQTFWLTRRDEE